MQADVSFLEYVREPGTTNGILAKFKDPTGESNGVFFTKSECEERLTNLRRLNLPYQETQCALDGWPSEL